MKKKLAVIAFCVTMVASTASAFAATTTPHEVEWPDWLAVHAIAHA